MLLNDRTGILEEWSAFVRALSTLKLSDHETSISLSAGCVSTRFLKSLMHVHRDSLSPVLSLSCRVWMNEWMNERRSVNVSKCLHNLPLFICHYVVDCKNRFKLNSIEIAIQTLNPLWDCWSYRTRKNSNTVLHAHTHTYTHAECSVFSYHRTSMTG